MRRMVYGLGIVAALFVIGCGGDDMPTNGNGNGNGNGGPANSIAEASGDGQRIAVGVALLQPLVVRVTDSDGNGVSGETVGWSVTEGGGSLSSMSTTTNSDGEASVTLTAGSSEGDNVVTAAATGLTGSPVTFTATAVAPAAIALTAGNNQSARVSQPLAQPFEVRVTASDNGAVPGATVNWAPTAGGGTVSASSSATDEDGRATTTLRLGSATGANSVSATVDGLMTSFDATGTTPVTVTINMANIAFVVPPASRPPGGGSDEAQILLGDTITWVNQDALNHTATSSSVPAGGTAFDSGLLGLNESFTIVPNARGDWVYFCTEHPIDMVDATIRVQ